jgi:DNA-binding beta-propeller fold protein YncE
MFVRTLTKFPIGAFLSLALLSDCNAASTAVPIASGAQARAVLQQPSGKMSGGGLMYTSQMYGNDASVYGRSGPNGLTLIYEKSLRKGLSRPQGTVTTANGWWYVANMGAADVLVYRTTKRGPEGPVSSLSDYGEQPINVDVNPDRNLVAVSNKGTTSGKRGSVSVYLNRQAVPSRTLTYGTDDLAGQGVAIDQQDNCYWSFNDNTTGYGSIVEFRDCKGRGRLLVSSIGAAGIGIDHGGNLYYLNTQSKAIYKCQKVSHCKSFAKGFSEPINMNFDAHYKNIWVADASGYIYAVSAQDGTIESTTEAKGGPTDPPFGIAPEPGS